MLWLSAARARRAMMPGRAVTPAILRKSRRRMFIARSPRLSANFQLANFQFFPAFFLAGRLENGSLRQSFRFPGRADRCIEIARTSGLFRCGELGFSRGPFVAQLPGLLLGGLGRRERCLVVGFGGSLRRPRA